LYLGQNKIRRTWQAIVFFPDRSVDLGIPIEYQGFIATEQLKVIYLNEITEESLGIGIVKLILEKAKNAPQKAQELITQTQAEISDFYLKRKVLELLETIVIYKLPNLSKKELESMFTFQELKQTQYFKDVAEEQREKGKIETIPLLIRLGLTAEKIAEELDLDIKTVKNAIKNIPKSPPLN
jgi:predicted transposase YdaD